MNAPTLSVRIAAPEDASALLDIYAPYVEQTAITFEYQTPSVEEFSDRISRTLKKYPYLAAQAGNTILGYAYAGPFKERAAYDWAAEVSIYVRQNAKRRGIGTYLYEALEQLLKNQNILNLYACIASPQQEDTYLTRDSIEFHRYMGYRIVGEFRQCGYKFNRWYNMVWMEKHIGSHIENQPPVQPLHSIPVILP